MINLLDTDTKRQYSAARMNMKLRGYLLLVLAVALGVIAVFGVGAYMTWSERNLAKSELTAAETSVSQYAKVRKDALTFSNNLKIAKSILSQEVLYSDMITRIAHELPSSAVLNSLTLDKETLSAPLTLDARVKTKEDAVTLKNTLEATPLFEDVNINSILEQAPGEKATGNALIYPVAVTLTMKASSGTPGSLLP